MVEAIIEIPAGSIEKWEQNKTTGSIERDLKDGLPRTIHYLGYPANYGFVPNTMLAKQDGGDGDPLDIIVLGAPCERGDTLTCKVIGVLKLLDKSEQDDKLVAIEVHGPLRKLESLAEMEKEYEGITTILETWFTNYKGPNKMVFEGWGDREDAIETLQAAMN